MPPCLAQCLEVGGRFSDFLRCWRGCQFLTLICASTSRTANAQQRLISTAFEFVGHQTIFMIGLVVLPLGASCAVAGRFDIAAGRPRPHRCGVIGQRSPKLAASIDAGCTTLIVQEPRISSPVALFLGLVSTLALKAPSPSPCGPALAAATSIPVLLLRSTISRISNLPADRILLE